MYLNKNFILFIRRWKIYRIWMDDYFDKGIFMKCRCFIAAGAVGIHISLGSVYAWSVFKKPFMDAFGWNEFEAGLPFGLAIFVLGMSAAVMGHVVERRGPRFSGFLATGLWGAV